MAFEVDRAYLDYTIRGQAALSAPLNTVDHTTAVLSWPILTSPMKKNELLKKRSWPVFALVVTCRIERRDVAVVGRLRQNKMRAHRVRVGKHFSRSSKVLCRDAGQGVPHFPFLIARSLARPLQRVRIGLDLAPSERIKHYIQAPSVRKRSIVVNARDDLCACSPEMRPRASQLSWQIEDLGMILRDESQIRD
jgi:hypothetical protein